MSEWVVPFEDAIALEALRKSFEEEEKELAAGRFQRFRIAEQVARVGPLKIEIFANEHPPPHFRAYYSGESANYRISDGEQINGGLKKYRGRIAKWFVDNRDKLIETWDRLRPTDCPVGRFEESKTQR